MEKTEAIADGFGMWGLQAACAVIVRLKRTAQSAIAFRGGLFFEAVAMVVGIACDDAAGD